MLINMCIFIKFFMRHPEQGDYNNHIIYIFIQIILLEFSYENLGAMINDYQDMINNYDL